MSSVQRQFDEDALRLPDVRPASIGARAWAALVRHVRDRVSYTALAAELDVSHRTVREFVAQAAAALRLGAARLRAVRAAIPRDEGCPRRPAAGGRATG